MNTTVLLENENKKILKSENYNFVFDKNTGFFARWGKTQKDDPQYSPVGPEIADIEISSICSGVKGIGVCKFCYKGNTPTGENMSFETFKKLFKKLPKTICQVAFGTGNIDSNPDMWKIFNYTRENGVIPNITVNGEGITDEIADRLVGVMGAVAVSVYDKEKSFDAIKKLNDAFLRKKILVKIGTKYKILIKNYDIENVNNLEEYKESTIEDFLNKEYNTEEEKIKFINTYNAINIHFMLSEETYDKAINLINDRMTDSRIKNLNAIVFLSLKPKGRAISNNFTKLSQEKFKKLIKKADAAGISYGMDSCSAAKYIKTLDENINNDKIMEMIEPCESLRMSLYINVYGYMYPCSFMDGEVVENGGDWTKGIDILHLQNFLKDVWYNEKSKLFREKCISCISNAVSCPVYKI